MIATSTTLRSLAVGALLTGFSPAIAQVPTYTVRTIATYSQTTTVRGASDAGHVVGDQVLAGQLTPIVATAAAGLVHLPLPPGYASGTALDANVHGQIVGAVSRNGFPFDSGEPAIWTPLAGGGHQVTIPQQFATVPGPFGQMRVDGGMAVAIDDLGNVVGWSRYQGFQGGPTTRFALAGAPVNLASQGFTATVTDLSDTTGILVGGELRMDLNTGVVTSLGLPPREPGSPSFTMAIAYAVNDAGQSILAVRYATSTNSNWITYRNAPDGTWTRHDPQALATRFVGFYDNNDRGDVAATGGLYFAAEDVLVRDVRSLLDASAAPWDVGLGFLADDRRMYTTGTDTRTRQAAIVVLEPKVCETDLGFQGPGAATATLCGTGLGSGQSSDYVVANAPASASGFLAVSNVGNPNLGWLGGTLVSFDGAVLVMQSADAAGRLSIPFQGFAGPAFDLVFQSVFLDPTTPSGVTITNAIQARFGN